MTSHAKTQQHDGDAKVRWHIYVDGRVMGPLTPSEMSRAYREGVFNGDCPIREQSWDRWHRCRDVLSAFAARTAQGSAEGANRGSLVKAALRIELDPHDSVALIHDRAKLVRLAPVNVSRTGLFVRTERLDFALGSRVTVTLKTRGRLPPFNATATVVRFNSDPRFPEGMGLKFDEEPQALFDCDAI